MADNGSSKRESAALLLASGKTIRAVAAELGIGERTLYRWREDPTFRKLEANFRGEMFNAGFGQLCATATKAASVLEELLASESEAIKLAAARTVLTISNDMRKTVELEQTIGELNSRLKELEAHFGPEEQS